jgi:hypothetical protein
MPFPAESYRPFQLSYTLDGVDYYLTGNATEGINVKSFALSQDATLTVDLDSADDIGEIALLVPRSMADNIISVKVTVSQSSTAAQIMQPYANSTHYALHVAIPPGTQNVIVEAAHVAPEFGLALPIAAISFAAIIVLRSLKKSAS